jgi:hypothetical protein
MKNNILISLKQEKYKEGNLVEVKLTSKNHEKRRFILLEKKLIAAMTNDETVYDKDCYNFIQLRYNTHTNRLNIEVTWLSLYGEETIKGYRQICSIPGAVVWQFLETGTTTKYLFRDEASYPRVEFSESAYKRIRKIVQEGGKRDLEKFFSKAFKYPGSKKIMVYGDPWIDGFMFIEDEGHGITGGIAPHKKTVKGRDGIVREYTAYEIHT